MCKNILIIDTPTERNIPTCPWKGNVSIVNKTCIHKDICRYNEEKIKTKYCCDDFKKRSESGLINITWGKHSIIINGNGGSWINVSYCPFCGSKL